MEEKNIYSKETMLVYLINELSSGNYEVITHLDKDGCWVGHIEIKQTNLKENKDIKYYENLLTNRKLYGIINI